MSTPRYAEPAIDALRNLNRNENASEKEQDTRTLSKRLTTLAKRNPTWSIILTLLATGGIAYAVWYAGLLGVPLKANLLKSAQEAAKTIKSSKSAAATALKKKSRSIIEGIRKAGIKITGVQTKRSSWWNPLSSKTASFRNIGRAGTRKLIVPTALAIGGHELRRYERRENVKAAMNDYARTRIPIPQKPKNHNANTNTNNNNVRVHYSP